MKMRNQTFTSQRWSAWIDKCIYPAVCRRDKRVALIIAAHAYENFRPLDNPPRDKAALTKQLYLAGYEIVECPSGTHDSIRKSIEELIVRSHSAKVALIHYSGHGIAIRGENYIVPEDAPRQVGDGSDLISISKMVSLVSKVANNTVVFLDACRYDGRTDMSHTDPLRGLVNPEMVLSPPRTADSKEGHGGHVVFKLATSPGRTADDGEKGKLSPFSQALADHVAAREQRLGQLYDKVRLKVHDATYGAQMPWMSASGNPDLKLNPYNPREIWLFVFAAILVGMLMGLTGYDLKENCRIERVSFDYIELSLRSLFVGSLLSLAAFRWGQRSSLAIIVPAIVFIPFYLISNDFQSQIYDSINQNSHLINRQNILGSTGFIFSHILLLGICAGAVVGVGFLCSGAPFCRGLRQLAPYILALGPVALVVIGAAIGMRAYDPALGQQVDDCWINWDVLVGAILPVTLSGGVIYGLLMLIIAQTYARWVPYKVHSGADT